MTRSTLVDLALLAFIGLAGFNALGKRGASPPTDDAIELPLRTPREGSFLARDVQPRDVRQRVFEATSSSVRLGPEDAPVRIVAFVDYACGHCAKLLRTLLAVHQNLPYVISIAFIDMPQPGNHAVLRTHLAVHCAQEQGQGLAMLQATAAAPAQAAMSSGWRALAREADISDRAALQACVGSQRHLETVERARAIGRVLEIDRTPILYLNDRKVIGAMPEGDLRSAVMEVLRPRN